MASQTKSVGNRVKPYFQDEWVMIYHGDCREILPELPKVDLVITSPPYNCRMGYGAYIDEVPRSQYYEMIANVLRASYQLLLRGGVIAINVPTAVKWQSYHKYANTWFGFDPSYKSHRGKERILGKARIEPLAIRLWDILEGIDYHIREPIIWVKGENAIAPTYAMGCDSDPYLRGAHEMILLLSKEVWFHRGGTGRRGAEVLPFMDETKDVWFINPKLNKHHPATFPEEIPSRLIRLFTHAFDAVILDPFVGIGSTLLAAKKLNRKCIGIEIEEKYCEIAANRCRQGVFKL